MKDLSQSISDAERELERLKKQAVEEKAMADVLPERFRHNMAAFEKYIPDIAKKFNSYKPEKVSRFFCNENGIPNLLWVEENRALYTEEPYRDCSEQIDSVLSNAEIFRLNFGLEKDLFDQIHVKYINSLVSLYFSAQNDDAVFKQPEYNIAGKSVPFCMMFGVGLGYQLGYLYERCTPKNLFVFEPDSDLFYASLFAFDWASLLAYLNDNALGLHLFVGQDENQLMEDMLIAINKRGAFLSANFIAFWHYPSPSIFKLMERVAKEFYMLTTGWGFFDDNLFSIAHSAENIVKKIPFLLKNKSVNDSLVQKPVFVLGNGPSLDAAIPYIRKFQNKAIIISCGSSISALHKENIKPDIYVAIERTKAVPDFIGLINDDDYLKDILFISTDVIHPDCHKYFLRSGLGFKPNEPMYPLLFNVYPDVNRFQPLSFINPLVGNIGVSLPVTLGFRNIYMFGLDNGYKDKAHHHSKYSAYYDENGNPIEELTKIVTSNSGFTLPGNFGGTVTANRLFASSLKVMENMLKFYGDITCHNCSDGALLPGATPLRPEEIVITGDDIDKNLVVDGIYNQMFAPLSVPVEQLQSNLSVNVFINVVDELINHWKAPIRSRDDAMERMQQQFEYVTSLSRCGYTHIYRVLVGTLNYLFAILSTVAYKFKDDKYTTELLEQSIAIMIDYFNDMKIKYPDALESKDVVDCEIIKLYRKN